MNPASFISRFPQFASVDPTDIQTIIDDADPYFNKCRWCNHYERGLGYFIAHNLLVQQSLADGTMPVLAANGSYTQKKVGEVSVSTGSDTINKIMDNPFMSTVYGQQYLYLARLVGMGAIAV